MKRNRVVSLFIAAIITLPIIAEEHPIALKQEVGPYSGSRTVMEGIVTAFCDDADCTLSFSFDNVSESEIRVYPSNDHDVPLIQQSYPSGFGNEIDLSSLQSGYYVVKIFAFNEWWVGCFELE